MSFRSRWATAVGLGLYMTSATPSFGQLARTISLDREVRITWGSGPQIKNAEDDGPWLGTIEGPCSMDPAYFVKSNQASWIGCNGLYAAGECATYSIRSSGFVCGMTARNSLHYSFELDEPAWYEFNGHIEKSGEDPQFSDASCVVHLREIDGPMVYFDQVLTESCQGCNSSLGRCIRAHGFLPPGTYDFEILASVVRGRDIGVSVSASYEIELSFSSEVREEPLVMSLVDPPEGTIDARQDRAAENEERLIDRVFIEFSNAVFDAQTRGSLTSESFDVSDTSGEPINIESFRRPDCPYNGDGLPESSDIPNAYYLTFDRPIRPGHWTTIVANVVDPNGDAAQNQADRVLIGFLPGDVNGDGLAHPGSDLLALIDSLNGVPGRVRPKYSTDINRSGVTSPQDVLRLIDLFNGVDTTRVWAAASLPDRP